MSETFMVDIFCIFFLVFVMIFITERFSTSKSKQYRETMSDMYVVGKIRNIAKGDDINLNTEFSEFAKVTKNKKIDFEALDSTIERELQEKIAESKKEAISPKE